ncbi:ZPR1 family protein [Megaselia abdita]
MKVTNIPHFKEVIIMATVCDVCGVKTNEVKSGGGIEDKGIRFEVTVETKEDLVRDVLKSETCSLLIKELECDVGPNALGGRFTTVEGILAAVKDQLEESGAIFRDSADDGSRKKFSDFIAKIDEVIENKRTVTLVLDDPAGNSYVQSLADDDQKDPKLKVERYERDYDQNEELGLNDMKTEGYEEH